MERARRVTLVAEELPPSVNDLYTVSRGRKILKTEGRKYINQTRMLFAEQLLDFTGFRRDEPLVFVYTFSFPVVLNKGFPKKAKNKFRKIDVSNRVKVLEDIICSVLDIDDSQVMHMEVVKCQGPPRACVSVQVYDGLLAQAK